MTQKELKTKYDNLVCRIEKEHIYDGREKGVDVYTCEKCGAIKYTRYKDKGVTPFTIGCKCGYTMVHDKTISELKAVVEKATVHNWVRPPFKWLDKQRKKNKLDVIGHVLNGGLVLESEL